MTAQAIPAPFTLKRAEAAETELSLRARASGFSASVAIRGLSKSFGPKKVLEDVDLTVPAGQFLAIVGRSGCGKSTLLRTIVGDRKSVV